MPTKNTESAEVNLSRKQVWGPLELPREDVKRGKGARKTLPGKMLSQEGAE